MLIEERRCFSNMFLTLTRRFTTAAKTVVISGSVGHTHNSTHNVPDNHKASSPASEITKYFLVVKGTNRKNPNSMRMGTVGLEHWLGQMVLALVCLNCLLCCATLPEQPFIDIPENNCQDELAVSWQNRSDLDVSALEVNGTAEAELLLDFLKGVTHDPLKVLSNWNLSKNHSNHCSWTGVECNSFTGEVIALNLTGSELTGSISPRLGGLKFLESLDLSNNSFQGFIPTSISNCSYLTTLNLSRNGVSGNIPSELATLSNLEVLDLSFNSLRGVLSPSLSNLSALRVFSMNTNQVYGDMTSVDWGLLGQLRRLNLSANQISGAIPESLNNCSNLVSLALTYNNFNGQITDIFGKLQKLQYLSLTKNALTGSIPLSLGNLANLRVVALDSNTLVGSIPLSLLNCSSMSILVLSNNNLVGQIPANIGMLAHLQFLHLQNNNLTGPIPPSLANCTLWDLDLSQNLLSGEIPTALGFLQNLFFLFFYSNNLEGSIPVSLSNCSRLVILDVSGNQLTGEIPNDIGLLSQIQRIYMWGNSLTGPIPTSLGNCTALNLIALDNNQLGGEIPAGIGMLYRLRILALAVNYLDGIFPRNLSNCTSLARLQLEYNFFSSEIPHEIGLLRNMISLSLQSNSFRGRIPVSLGNNSNLQTVLLESNYLSGEIPPQLGQLTNLQGLNLSYNLLTGGIPLELSNCRQLYELDLSGNSLSGSIPDELGTLATLRQLYLKNNNFTGSISSVLGQKLTNLLDINLAYNSLSGSIAGIDFAGLQNLQIRFDISHNLFTGSLPSNIGALQTVQNINFSFNSFSGSIPDAFSQCIALTSLDLSSNNLDGQIPQSLTTLHLTYFNVSNNQLSGSIPSQFDNFSDGAFLGNPNLCGPMLHNNCNGRCHGILCHRLWIIIVPIVVGIIGSLVLVGLCFLFVAKKRGSSGAVEVALTNTSHSTSEFGDLSLEDMVVATRGFSDLNIVGVGAKSKVFVGMLPSGVTIAVKRFELGNDDEGIGRFSRELQKLSKLEHPNLLKVHGLFYSWDLKVLGMEYMPNGSLHKQLYDGEKCHLTWAQRLNVTMGVGEAMVHLHTCTSRPIIHGDLHPSNIFLDVNMEPKVGDYGISRFVNHDSNGATTVSSNFYGTIGYIPPEYGAATNVSTMGDVYNFGLVLIELFTRKQPKDDMFGQEVSYRSWVVDAFPDRISQILDPTLNDELARNEQDVGIHLIVRLAIACTRPAPKERPTMAEARDMLSSTRRASILYS